MRKRISSNSGRENRPIKYFEMSSERTAFNIIYRRVRTNREAPDDEKKATSVIKQYALHYQVAAHTHNRSITEKLIEQSFFFTTEE